MRLANGLLQPYSALLARFALADGDLERELTLIDASELGKAALDAGPAVDQMHELHQLAQAAVARDWGSAPAGSDEQRGRERLAQGDGLALLLALVLPHELAQRAHHEQRWRREHETLVAMFEQTEDMIVVLDSDGQCDDVNPAFCRQTGWSRREAVEGAAAWPTPPQGASAQRRRSQQARRDGGSITVDWSVSSILGHQGQLLSHICIGRDVGRQQQIDDGLRENDKLRAVATLAGGIAHDFNNLLGSINGLAELCELDAPAGSRQARNLGRIRQAGDKAAALVRQMLDFSRQTPPTLQRLSVAEWLGHADGLLRAALPHQHTLSVQVLADGQVHMDLVQMEQVLLNLVRNASQAMGGGSGGIGHIRIVADRAEPASPNPAAAGAAHVRLRLSDTGSGIAPDLLGKIFEPFFTTKPVGEGTGLGLAAVHGIVSGHGGVVAVHSSLGAGTTFSLFLPLADTAGSPA